MIQSFKNGSIYKVAKPLKCGIRSRRMLHSVATPEHVTLGFIGTGVMGQHMCGHLYDPFVLS